MNVPNCISGRNHEWKPVGVQEDRATIGRNWECVNCKTFVGVIEDKRVMKGPLLESPKVPA